MSVIDILLWAPIVGPLLWLTAKIIMVWFAVSIIAVGLPLIIGVIAHELRRIGHEADE